jgi:hypothetical protein
LFVLEAEIADGQRAAAGLAARVDERHPSRVGRGVDRLPWKAFRGRVFHSGILPLLLCGAFGRSFRKVRASFHRRSTGAISDSR